MLNEKEQKILDAIMSAKIYMQNASVMADTWLDDESAKQFRMLEKMATQYMAQAQAVVNPIMAGIIELEKEDEDGQTDSD